MTRFRLLFWDFVHQCIAHPLLFFTREARFAVRFHDATEPYPPARIAWSGGPSLPIPLPQGFTVEPLADGEFAAMYEGPSCSWLGKWRATPEEAVADAHATAADWKAKGLS